MQLSRILSRGLATILLLVAPAARARNLMSADGPGGTPTYDLLHQAYTTELPDCGHMVPHITEVFDDELKKNVFVFHAHVNQDDDRCGGKDRQRTEIRAKSTDIVAQNGETVYYRWKFRLDQGFQGSTRFTHIFQIKSDLGAPIMTLTPRVSTFGITGRAAGSSGNTDLAKFRGVWVVVDLKVLFSDSGHVDLTIRRISDGQTLYAYAGNADMWDANASGHDSKFGIYRSLDAKELLRDEQVRFADFCASKVNAKECDDGAVPPNGGPPPHAGAPADAEVEGTGGAPGTGGMGEPAGTGGRSGTGGTTGTGGAVTTEPTGGKTGTSTSDAAAPSRSDARPAEPSGDEDPPAEEPPVRKAAGGCHLGGNGGGLGVLAVALLARAALRRRKTNSASSTTTTPP